MEMTMFNFSALFGGDHLDNGHFDQGYDSGNIFFWKSVKKVDFRESGDGVGDGELDWGRGT